MSISWQKTENKKQKKKLANLRPNLFLPFVNSYTSFTNNNLHYWKIDFKFARENGDSWLERFEWNVAQSVFAYFHEKFFTKQFVTSF